MLDTSHSFDTCEVELGCEAEQLFTPLTRFRPQRLDQPFAIDNGAYSKFSPRKFLSLLQREYPRRSLCRFVAVPDVVGCAQATQEHFEIWAPILCGWPLAFVCQDGQEQKPLPLSNIAALFIGGSTKWKLGEGANHCILQGKQAGKWVHVGRVNTPKRFKHFEALQVDSVDGSGLGRFSRMRVAIRNRNL